MNAPLFRLATRPRHHLTNWAYLPAQTERSCEHCHAVKVTVFSSDGKHAWTEWRLPETGYQDRMDEPECIPQ